MKRSVRPPWFLSAGITLLVIPFLAATFAPPENLRAFRVPVEGEVDGVMLETIRRRIDIALDNNAEIIFFEIDSYGGRVDWAESIAHLIDTTPGPKKVAYIPNKAISAGAFIALACDEIVMHPNATMGDCQPIIPSFTGPPQPAGEKMESAFRKKMAAYAEDESRGYPVALTKAMVSPHIEVLRVPGAEGKEYEYVERDDLYSWSENLLRVRQIFDQTDPSRDMDGKRTFIALVDGEEQDLEVVVKEGEILTMSGKQALEYGFSSFLVEDFDEALPLYGVARDEVGTLPTLWWESFIKVLNSMPAKGLLVLLGLIGIFIELKAPGFGLPGILGIVCFALIFYAGHLAGLAQWIEIIMFGAGLVLIALEIFIIPGFGVAGIAGIILALSSLILALVSFSPLQIPSSSFHWQELREATTMVFGAIGAFAVALVVLVRYLPKTPILGRLMLGASVSAEEGYAARVEHGQTLLGKEGVSRTVLRPAGKIEVDGVTYDAAAQGVFINPGEAIKIIDTSGNRIIVRKA